MDIKPIRPSSNETPNLAPPNPSITSPNPNPQATPQTDSPFQPSKPEPTFSPEPIQPQPQVFVSGGAPEPTKQSTEQHTVPKPFTPETTNSYTTSPNKKGLFRATAYLPEYAVSLVLLGVILSAITSLLAIGVQSLAPEEAGAASGAFSLLGDIDTFQLMWSLSALVATLPVFIWLFIRTRNHEKAAPAVKTHRWRKAFLGIFLVIQGLAVVATIGSLVFNLLSRVVGDGSDYGFAGSEPVWVPVVVNTLSVMLLTYVIYVMSRDYRSQED